MSRSEPKAPPVDRLHSGAGVEGGRGRVPAPLYGPDGPVSREEFQKLHPDELHQFRLVVSPEDGHELELEEYVRCLMRRIERHIGQALEWAAANLCATEVAAAHVVIRGVDVEGHQVWLSDQYLSQDLQWTAEVLATEVLGPRLESEIQGTRDREVFQARMTSLDRELEQCIRDQRIDIASVRRQARRHREAKQLLDRLEHLERLGLAERVSLTSWRLEPFWQRYLRALR